METVQQIIDLFGGLAKLRPIKLEVAGLMPLCIESIGTSLNCGPHGGAMISVAHYYEQNGDLMRDPEIVFEVKDHAWHPMSFTQDNLGLYQEAMYQADGRWMVRPHLLSDLQSFAKQWDKNLRDQGFLDSAKKKAAREEPPNAAR